MSRGILVIGMNRSGTKWLSNELAKYDQIIAVQNDTTGIRESNAFNAYAKKFDLSRLDEYIALIELWSSTEYWQLTEVDKQGFYSLESPPRTVQQVYDQLMDTFANDHGKRYWLQKFPPESAEVFDLSTYHLILIKRNIKDQIISSLGRFSSKISITSLAKAILSYTRQENSLNRLSKKYRAIEVDYDDFKNNKKEILDTIIEFHDIDSGTRNEAKEYRPNTTFKNKDKNKYTSLVSDWQIHMIYTLAKLIPDSLLRYMSKSNRENMHLVPGSYAHIYDQFPQLRKAYNI